jgi:hypothetical protein
MTDALWRFYRWYWTFRSGSLYFRGRRRKSFQGCVILILCQRSAHTPEFHRLSAVILDKSKL